VRKTINAARAAAWEMPAHRGAQEVLEPCSPREHRYSRDVIGDSSQPQPEDYRAAFTLISSTGHSKAELEPLTRYLMLADLALLKAVREEQSRIKQKIKPHVERYRKITGNKR
jgi:hypothetical protein